MRTRPGRPIGVGSEAGTPLVKASVGGVRLNPMRFDAAIRAFLDAPASGRQWRVHFCTAHTVVEANAAPRLMEVLNTGQIVACDGMPLVWLLRMMGFRAERVYGPDVLLALADRGREMHRAHYFYGGAEGTADRLSEHLTKQFPGLVVAGAEAPPFRPLSDAERRAVIGRINASGADYVWVGLGTPKQDYWLSDFRSELRPSVLFAVGAAFDFLSGTKPRAPRFMQRTGTEWLFRLATEPRRLWRRYLMGNGRFVWIVARSAVTGRRVRTIKP